jgi:hypothetical protein
VDQTVSYNYTFQSAAGATGDGTVNDVGGLPAVAVQITGITTATITFEGAVAPADGTFVAVEAFNTANGIYLVPTAGLSQLRCRISAWTSGDITAIGRGVTSPGALFVSATGGSGSSVAVTTVGGQTPSYGAGAVDAGTQRETLASNDPAVVALQIMDDWDESDRAKVNPIVGQAGVQGGSGGVSALTQRVVLATDVALPAGTNSLGFLGGYSFANRAANSTVTHKSGAGVCHGVCINTAGSGNTITLYDNTAGSGTVIAVIDTTVTGLFELDAAFATGLTSVTAAGTPADLTVLWR